MLTETHPLKQGKADRSKAAVGQGTSVDSDEAPIEKRTRGLAMFNLAIGLKRLSRLASTCDL